jgi:hypothetical protein
MPIIINAPGPVRVTHSVQASPGVLTRLAHQVRATPNATPVRLVHVVTARPAQLARLVHAVSARSTPGPPTVIRAGRPIRQTTITSSNGQVLSAQYSHSGTRESLVLTVVGTATPAAGTMLNVTVSETEGSLSLGSLAISLDADPNQYEQRTTANGVTSTLYGYNKAASQLGSFRLSELIPWQLSPTPPADFRIPCAGRPTLQQVGVTDTLVRAFAQAGMSLAIPGGDPFVSQTWRERDRDYSTLNKTPDQVFADSLGQLGYTYVVRGTGAYALPPGQGFVADTVNALDLEGQPSIRAEAANAPSRIVMTGAPLLAAKVDILQLAANAPDPASLTREVSPTVDWYVTTPTAGGEVIKGFRKVLGVITSTVELILSDVTVTETVNGTPTSRTFSHVVTGFTSSSSMYDPNCSDAMIRQDTVKKTYSYTLNTQTTSQIFSGPGFGGSCDTGDTLSDESQTIFQTFSAEGYLSARVTNSTKLVSLQQTAADGPAAGRGAMQGREYLKTVLSENFAPIQGGQWLRTFSLSGAQQLPLYDATSGDAVRLTTRGGTFNSASEVLDAAPAQVRCPDPCSASLVSYPQVLTAVLPAGREGQERTSSVPMVADGAVLNTLMQNFIKASGSTVSSDVSLSAAKDWRPGVNLSGQAQGVVESFSLNASGGLAHTNLQARRRIDGVGSVVPTIPANREYRDQVLWRRPGGVVVNHMKAIVNGTPTFDQIFVRAAGATQPNPGDELVWRVDTRFGPTATGNYGGNP